MSNRELKELLEWMDMGDPIKDHWDPDDLLVILAIELAKARGIKIPWQK